MLLLFSLSNVRHSKEWISNVESCCVLSCHVVSYCVVSCRFVL